MRAPWVNRIDARVAQDFYFTVAGRKQTLEIGVDIKNIGNMLDSDFGLIKQHSGGTTLTYKNGAYTFNKPVWKNYVSTASTWQMLFSAKWFF